MRTKTDDYHNFQQRVFDQLGEMETVDEGERKQIFVSVLNKLGVDPVLYVMENRSRFQMGSIKCIKGRSADEVQALIERVIAERRKAR
ncbi:MAG: hypothetical protein WA637_23720 [Terriglobales bacterium]